MYHGHNLGLFNARVDPKTPHFGPTMRTSCRASTGVLFCLGDFFPTLRRLHPDHKLSLFFNTIQSPVIKFRPPSMGGITFSLAGHIGLSVIENSSSANETLTAEMAITVSAHMKIRLTNTVVRPRITLDSIKLKTLSPGILLQDELDRSVVLAREVLQRMVNDVLKVGIPIPIHPLMRLIKPKAKILDRAILLQTNIEFKERLLRKLTSANLDKHGSAI